MLLKHVETRLISSVIATISTLKNRKILFWPSVVTKMFTNSYESDSEAVKFSKIYGSEE